VVVATHAAALGNRSADIASSLPPHPGAMAQMRSRRRAKLLSTTQVTRITQERNATRLPCGVPSWWLAYVIAADAPRAAGALLAAAGKAYAGRTGPLPAGACDHPFR
jgi:hypothetical protein